MNTGNTTHDIATLAEKRNRDIAALRAESKRLREESEKEYEQMQEQLSATISILEADYRMNLEKITRERMQAIRGRTDEEWLDSIEDYLSDDLPQAGVDGIMGAVGRLRARVTELEDELAIIEADLPTSL